jgi:filamentous hemagglutinin
MAWIKEQQEKGTFVYTPTQETVDYIKNDLKTNVLPVASNSLKMVTGGLSAATGTTLCSTTGVGCAPGSLLITFGVSNLTEGLSGLYRQYQGIDTVGYNPLKYWFNQADPVWGNTMYYSLDFAVAIMAMRAQVPLNLGVADGLGRPTSMFGVTVSNFSNIKLNPFTKMPLPYGVNQGSLAIGAGAKGVEIINSISIAEDKK